MEEPAPLKYPISIGFIIAFEFCERFNYYGFMAVFYIYLNTKLLYDGDVSTSIIHVFVMAVHLFPAIGAVIADSWLGKFKVIFIFSILYSFSMIGLVVSALPITELTLRRLITILALLIIAIGAGLIKPCVAAIGGDQFKLPEQEKQLSKFFSYFYYAINAGSLLAMILTPILRFDVNCFGEVGCFSLAIGVPAITMTLGVIIFTLGRAWYTIKKPSGNMLVRVSKCIVNAISQRIRLRRIGDKREHWLDYSKEAYGEELVADTKAFFRMIVLFLPLPMFWALFTQMSSRWTDQAIRMNGELGSYIMKPDHMQAINPFLVLCFLPLFDYVIYPSFEKVNLARPLQKITIGGIVSGVSFVISGFIELQLESTYPVLPYEGNAQLRIFNGYDSAVSISFSDSSTTIIIQALGLYEDIDIRVKEAVTKSITMTPLKTQENEGEEKEQGEKTNTKEIVINIKIREQTAMSLFIFPNGTKYYEDDVDKPKKGYPVMRFLFVSAPEDRGKTIRLIDHETEEVVKSSGAEDVKLEEVDPSVYDVMIGNQTILSDIKLSLGGGYALVVAPAGNGTYRGKLQTVVLPNSMHMFWLLPQYVVITMGEIMFSVTGMEFTFSQAPVSMKSILQACWMLTVSVGNIIIAVVAAGKVLRKQSHEFFLFATLMFAVMVIFMIIAKKYKYVTPADGTHQQ